jgi:predicted metal-dependent hydrolase
MADPTYTIRKSKRARHIRLTIKPDGSITVVVPYRLPAALGHAFFRLHKTWAEKALQKIARHPVQKHIGTAADFKKHKNQALSLAQEKVTFYAKFYGLSYNKIFIRNQTSKWGSCSSKRNLSFNYRIVFLPETLANYLVIHEICHLQEMNHSEKFWQLVARAAPNYKELRNQMRHIVLQ